MRIIDPPSPFAPPQEWREFLASLLTIVPRDAQERVDLDENIAMARRQLTGASSERIEALAGRNPIPR